MAVLARSTLTNSQLSPFPSNARLALQKIGTVLHQWRRRRRERLALAQLNDRELKDFGATRADVYRETSLPFWRSQLEIDATPTRRHP